MILRNDKLGFHDDVTRRVDAVLDQVNHIFNALVPN